MIEPAVADWLRRLTAEYFRGVSSLPIGNSVRDVHDCAPPSSFRVAEGVARIDGLLQPSMANAMRDAVVAITNAGLPGVFAYVYDPFWETALLAKRAVAAFAQVECKRVRVLPDVWAFFVPPGPENRGWAPHRGVSSPNHDADGHVKLVNVWFALSAATRASSCMYVVPLDRDPHVPGSLERLPDESAGIACELAPGGALLWDANVAHWGGASSARAVSPRISASYTCSTELTPGVRPVDLNDLGFERRLAIIADQISTYAEVDGRVAPEIVAWARVFRTLAGSISR